MPTAAPLPSGLPCALAGRLHRTIPFPEESHGLCLSSLSLTSSLTPAQGPRLPSCPFSFFTVPSLRPACLCARPHVTAPLAPAPLRTAQRPWHPHISVSNLVWPSLSRFGPSLTSLDPFAPISGGLLSRALLLSPSWACAPLGLPQFGSTSPSRGPLPLSLPPPFGLFPPPRNFCKSC